MHVLAVVIKPLRVLVFPDSCALMLVRNKFKCILFLCRVSGVIFQSHDLSWLGCVKDVHIMGNEQMRYVRNLSPAVIYHLTLLNCVNLNAQRAFKFKLLIMLNNVLLVRMCTLAQTTAPCSAFILHF